MLPEIGIMTEFEVQTLGGPSKTFSWAGGVGFVAQLIDPYLKFDHEWAEVKLFGAYADRYATLEH